VKEELAKKLFELQEIEEMLKSVQEEIDALEAESTISIEEIAKTKGLPSPTKDGMIKMHSLLAGFETPNVLEEIQTKGKKPSKESDYLPSDEDMAKINQLSNIDLSKEDVYVFSLKSADTNVDRGYEHFLPKAIKQMAEMSIDKPFLMDHNWSTSTTLGKIYDASAKGNFLNQKVYMLNLPENQHTIKSILGGIYNKVSVGFALDPMDYVCDSCNHSMYSIKCVHTPGMKDELGNTVTAKIAGVKDYFEISLVAVPMQPAAGIRRNSFTPILENDESTIANGKILEEKQNQGDHLVTEQVNQEVANEAPTEVVSETPVTKTEEQPTEPITNPVNDELMEVVAKLTSMLEKINSTIEANTKAIEEIKETGKAQAEAMAKAAEVSNEEIARRVLASSITSNPDAAPKGLAADLASILYNKENQ